MVSRFVIRCHGCKNRLVLRIQVAAGLSPFVVGGVQAFVFACPHCRSGIHGKLNSEIDKPPLLQGEDFDVAHEQEDPADTAVTVATDLPVHSSLIGYPARQQKMTPFIQLTRSLDSEVFVGLMTSIGQVRQLRELAFPYVRRASSFFMRGDLTGMKSALLDAPNTDDDFAEVELGQMLGVAFADIYEPLEDPSLSRAAAVESARMVEDTRLADGPALTQLLTDLEKGPLPEHRKRVLDTALAALEDVEALLPAMWAERIEGVAELNDYRVMRDDFDSLKSRYVDVFELGSRSLAFMARVANIAIRGDVRLHSDGVGRSLKKAVDGTPAKEREAWLDDFPNAKRLYDAIKRHTRNDIGHRLVRYDFESGSLVYEDGTNENYLLFLVDYLHAVGLTHYLLDVVFALG